jgi:diguanylate cyclase (GGDEF)-like protein
MPATIADGNPDDAQFRRRRELAEMSARGSLGGVFYVLAWFVAAICGGLHRRDPALVVAGGIVFAALNFARIALARRESTDIDTIVRLLGYWWTLLLVTAALWGATATWVLVDPRMQEARLPALICSVAFGAAFVHTYATRWHYALCGVTLLLLPVVVLAWTLADFGGIAFSLTVFVVYLLSSLRLSWQQYERQLLLELALLHQRNLYEKQSRTDALTGLDNRREFTFNLERALMVGEPLSLLLIDIDHFKQINDRYGHAAGDAVLIAFAGQLRELFTQPNARVARIGGEEFAVLLGGVPEASALTLAQHLCERVERAPLAPDAARGTVTVSVGVGQLRLQRSPDEFLAEVDRALYRAKQQGRNRVCRA